jgi:hypothetical protein
MLDITIGLIWINKTLFCVASPKKYAKNNEKQQIAHNKLFWLITYIQEKQIIGDLKLVDVLDTLF